MALAQIYSAVAGHVITAARWNNEFGNIYNNGTDVAFPVTKAVSFAGFTVTLDAAGVTTLTSTASTGVLVTVGSKAGTPSANGSLATVAASTMTDTGTSGSGTLALYTGLSIRRPTLAAANTLVTTTKAATLYIENAPLAGTNETITNPYAIYVDAGKVQFDDALQVDGALTVGGAATITGALSVVGGITAANADPYALTNITLVVTMAGNAATVALKTAAGTDPTATDAISLRFRNATLATGGTTNVSITAAQSLVIPDTATLGTINAVKSRIYIGLLNNAGVAELFVYNPLLSPGSLRGLTESQLLTSTTIGITSDNAQVPYSTTGRTGVAFRVIGFFESTQATAGAWGTAVSTIQELQPWMPRTGHVVNKITKADGTYSGDKTTTIPIDDTPPQVGEGTQIFTQDFAPSNACNMFEIDANIAAIVLQADASAVTLTVAMFTSISASAITCDQGVRASVSTLDRGNCRLFYRSHLVGTMTSVEIRGGLSVVAGAETWSWNGNTAGTDLSALMGSTLTITEIMT